MKKHFKDIFYEDFLENPTKDKFRDLLKNNFGELDEFDFKEAWIEKGKLAKLVLAMANSRGGVVIFGIKQKDDGTFEPVGLEKFKDDADINNDLARYISPNLYYEIFNFDYKGSEYEAVENKKFQVLIVNDTPDKLPFISLNQADGLTEDTIYIRRGTKSEKATNEDIARIIDDRIKTIYKDGTNLELNEHLSQLKQLYNELPQKIKVLIRKGEPTEFGNAMQKFAQSIGKLYMKSENEYEEKDNPSYPEESYEAFILRMIEYKKLKIEKVLDLK